MFKDKEITTQKAQSYASQKALSTYDLEGTQGLRRPHFCFIYGSTRAIRL